MKYGRVLGLRTDSADASVILCALSSSIGSPVIERDAPDRGSSDLDSRLRGNDIEIIDRIDWTAGRQLSASLLATIEELLGRNNCNWPDLAGVVVYEGPGSFTGLRIGITVANTAAFILDIPIASATGDDWLASGMKRLQPGHFSEIVMPAYGSEPNISQPKK